MATIDRTGASALMPESVAREILDAVPQASSVLTLGRRLPDIPRQEHRMPVLSGLVSAYFVDGEPTQADATKGLKRTSRAQWANKFIYAEELAVIVPIAQNVLDDTDYDIFGQVQPQIVTAMGAAIDQAVYYGVNAPSSWPDDLVDGATAAGNTVVAGTGADLYDDIMSENGAIAKVEEDGYLPNGHVGALSMRSKLRGLRDANGQPIFMTRMTDRTSYELDGDPIVFPRNGAIDPAESLLITGDWDQLVWAMRQDLTYSVLTEATLYDTDGTTILYRLAQQDMVALRAVMRLGWQLPNPINYVESTEADRYPFSILLPAA